MARYLRVMPRHDFEASASGVRAEALFQCFKVSTLAALSQSCKVSTEFPVAVLFQSFEVYKEFPLAAERNVVALVCI